MKLRFLLLAVAGLGMFACAKDGAEGPAVPDGSKSIVLKIALPQTTRAYIEPDTPYVPDGTTISKIDVYFTNDNGTIEQSYRIDDSGADSNMEAITNGTGLRFAGLKDATRVYCVANSDEALITTGSIKDFSKALSVQKPEMAQSASIFVGYDDDLTPFIADTDENIPTVNDPGAPEAGDIAYQATITIRPLISRIEWGKITIQSEGGKKITENGKDYFVVWQNWTPKLTGIYQSNVYLTSKIFADANRVDTLFATPASMADIVNGAWSGDTKGAILSYSNYNTGTSSYNALFADLGDYNTKAEANKACVPFHFFVPFDATAESTSNNVNATEQFAAGKKPHWHFQFHYASPSYTVKVYDYDGSDDYTHYLSSGTPATGDDALKVEVGFTYPVGPGNLTYANVDRLLQSGTGTGTGTEIIYQPGKIYKIEEVIFSPEIISASLTPTTDYNVIVKVTVADFEKQEVTPGFN